MTTFEKFIHDWRQKNMTITDPSNAQNPFHATGDADLNLYHCTGPNFDGLTHKGRGAQDAARREAENMNAAYQAGLKKGKRQ